MSEQNEAILGGERHHEVQGAVAVAVITPSGTFPDDEDYRRAYESEIVGVILEAAKKKLGLTDTLDWHAFVENRPIDPARSFAANDLFGIVEIEWHPDEGGGGA
jgi:hypothetical protein